MKNEVQLPTCLACPCHVLFVERYPIKQNGVLMKPGERYCLGKKKAVRFTAKDPKKYPPSWCPKRKSPCELRVYGFKSTQDWYLHDKLCRDLGKAISPQPSHYCVEHEGTTELTPRQFWEELEEHFISELLQVPVQTYWIVEIDDGLKPVCFYKTENGVEIVPFFDTAKARANRKEEGE